MLEGFKGEPEEDDGVEEAIQTMGPEDLQNRGEKDGGEGGTEEEEEEEERCGGLEAAGDSKKRREGETEREKKHEKRVWGAPAFQVTPDLGPLCQPSARLSGGFVGASSLNGHPADRHVVYPLCVLCGRERLSSVCASSERQVDNVTVRDLT